HVLFFFQAEDGIRDYHVTGVQTCALPISSDHLHVRGEHVHQVLGAEQRGGPPPRAWRAPLAQTSGAALVRTTSTCVESTREASRSEERRVGKEGRAGWPAGRATRKEGA